MSSTASVIIVEDEGVVALDLKRRLERMGYSVAAQASGGREAVEKVRETAPDLVLMDISLGEDLDGIEAGEIIRGRLHVPVVYLTAHSDRATLERAKATEPQGYVLKPFRDRELQIAIEMALYKHKAEMIIWESREWLAATLRSVGEAVIANDRNGAISFMNPAAEKLTGWREEEAKGRPLGDVLRLLDGATREPQQNAVGRIVSEGRPHPLPENTLLLPRGGEPVPIEDSFAPIQDPKRGVLGAVLVFHDVTQRREAEQRIRRLNEDLQRNVAELDAFSYSVAHDLRAPLRSINGFSAILLEDYEQKLDDEGKHHLQRIRRASQRMAQLIDDLLRLAQMSRAGLRRTPVDLSDLAWSIAEELKKGRPDRSVEFLIQPGATAEGDPDLLRIALDNLLRNAWKFTSKRLGARIEFGHRDQEEQRVYFVRDNGTGFDIAYAGKLFELFERLHSDAEFPGTGVGLATVQRVIRRHGGRVWAEGRVGEGACFYFTLPDATAAEKAPAGKVSRAATGEKLGA